MHDLNGSLHSQVAQPDSSELQEWYGLGDQIKALQTRERELRAKITSFYFRDPTEGVNKHDLGNGWTMEMTHKITRDIDPASLHLLQQELINACINTQELVNYKPSLVLRNYKTLSEEQRQVFDNVLVIKPATATLKFVPPKADKPA